MDDAPFDPFNPDEFGDVFAEALSKIADDGEVDCAFGERAWEGLLSIGGINYRVRIIPDGFAEAD